MSTKVEYYNKVSSLSSGSIQFPAMTGVLVGIVGLALVGATLIAGVSEFVAFIPPLILLAIAVVLVLVVKHLMRVEQVRRDKVNAASLSKVGITAGQAEMLLSHAASENSRSLYGVRNSGGVFVVSESTYYEECTRFHMLAEGDGELGSSYGSLEVLV